jgi:dTDP-glucose 4,6-dehydratase
VKNKILITGGAGFIGSNFVNTICRQQTEYEFLVLDALTYAGKKENINASLIECDHIDFIKADVRDALKIEEIFSQHKFSGVIHFAAESHVDRSIENPNIFFETNALGTLNLLKESLKLYEKNVDFRYLQISTDEVYGQLTLEEPAFTEKTPIDPSSPYSSSKASADLLVNSFHHTYQLPTLITRCSNNYGPLQFPEKLIPVMILKASADEALPVYGDGKNIRDWIHVHDHNRGVWKVFTEGRIGEAYNLGGNREISNLDLVKTILDIMDKPHSLINFVKDRLGHDFRYAMNISKIEKELGWRPEVSFEKGIRETISHYLN